MQFDDDFEEPVEREDDEPEEDQTVEWTDEWGIKRFSVYQLGDWLDGYVDPRWEHVYDENGRNVPCPSCDAEELRYHNGHCCCIDCYQIFSDQEIEDFAGPWHISW